MKFLIVLFLLVVGACCTDSNLAPPDLNVVTDENFPRNVAAQADSLSAKYPGGGGGENSTELILMCDCYMGTSNLGSSNLGSSNLGSSNLGSSNLGSSNLGSSNLGSSNLIAGSNAKGTLNLMNIKIISTKEQRLQ
ncbi:hypothetical protein CORC01_11692 [Colletotrichum orchidophilum]|uniref:Uncharacterized protein n=1 Tax=Colletotrichum orchidophilum TaxID=1209926 RepID=A0A1G4AUX0_9PEZI|nr:uncharacterized protein CORC01_11692 [Colletotrichum orchidophilum]OHE92969.1 hypothetical protein CORC01_11692 [Colletotrichum orchidophilum]